MAGSKRIDSRSRSFRDNKALGVVAVLSASIALALLAGSIFDVHWNDTAVLDMNGQESTLAHGLWSICYNGMSDKLSQGSFTL
jgi:hypothetical protein